MSKPDGEKVEKVTISVPRDLWEAAKYRAKTMNPPYKGVSAYVTYLIWDDINNPKEHVRRSGQASDSVVISGETEQFTKSRPNKPGKPSGAN